MAFARFQRAMMLCLVVGAGCASTTAEPPGTSGTQPEKLPAVNFGEKFPAAKFENLASSAGSGTTVDLGQVLGKKPIVFLYWIAGNMRSENLLRETEQLVAGLGGKVMLFGVVMPQPGRDAEAIRGRIRELNLKIPVLSDEGFVLGQRLRVQAVPHLAIVDAEGRLRLTNGASLHQALEYEMDLTKAIRRVAESGSLGTYGYLAQYYPVRELVGKHCPDFTAPLLTTSVEQRWSSLISGDKLNILIFWSVDCPHCRAALPQINDWLKQHSEGLNVFSAAVVDSEATKVKTREFCDLNGFVFPTLIDRDRQISALYQVTSTPTILIIAPNGQIDTVLLTGDQEFGKAVEEKKRALLKGA